MADAYDSFVSYNSKDRSFVEAVVGRLRERFGLRLWCDWDEIAPGDAIQARIQDGFQRSRTVTVFLGAHGKGPWQDSEIQAFVARAINRGGHKIIPVLLPGAALDALGESLFLDLRRAEQLQHPEQDEVLRRLVWGITGQRPDAPAAPAAPPTPEESPEQVVAQLGAYLPEGRIVPVVGTWLEAQGASGPALADALARQLVTDLSLQPEDRPLLAPADISGWYLEIKHGGPGLEQALHRVLASEQGGGVRRAHLAVARLARDLQQRRAEGSVQVVVTTNLDLALERALVLTGTSFTRVVPLREQTRVLCGPVRVRTEGAEVVVAVEGSPRREERLALPPLPAPGGTAPPELAAWPHWQRLDDAIVGQDLFLYPGQGDSREARDLVLPADWPRVVLVKLQGTIEQRDSYVFTPTHRAAAVDRWRDQLPAFVTGALRDAAVLLLGYCEIDPALLLLRQLLLRRPHQGDCRVLARPAPDPALDPLTGALWAEMRRVAQAHGDTPLAASCAGLLEAVEAALARTPRGGGGELYAGWGARRGGIRELR